MNEIILIQAKHGNKQRANFLSYDVHFNLRTPIEIAACIPSYLFVSILVIKAPSVPVSMDLYLHEAEVGFNEDTVAAGPRPT